MVALLNGDNSNGAQLKVAPFSTPRLFDNAQEVQRLSFSLRPENLLALANLCGQNNNNLQQIERSLEVYIANNSYQFTIEGKEDKVKVTKKVIQQLYEDSINEIEIDVKSIHLCIQQAKMSTLATKKNYKSEPCIINTPRCRIQTRGHNQSDFVHGIRNNAVQFGVGPAGTGKTWIAVACALESLFDKKVERVVLTRPAVEAGEKLGFLPGDLSQKVDPYLRPLFDALYDMVGTETIDRLITRNVIEVAPLAFMRGRSLNNAFIILDEAQNTTIEQMKMLLTRIGFGSKAVITGDLSQIDLPAHITSGLSNACTVLEGVEETGFTRFNAGDVIRHQVVQNIVHAYDAYQKEAKEKGKGKD